MKTYEVQLKRTTFMTYSVEASSEEEAQAAAWKALERSVDPIDESVEWDVAAVWVSEEA